MVPQLRAPKCALIFKLIRGESKLGFCNPSQRLFLRPFQVVASCQRHTLPSSTRDTDATGGMAEELLTDPLLRRAHGLADVFHDRVTGDLDTSDYLGRRRVSNLQSAALQPEHERLEGLKRELNSDWGDLTEKIRSWFQEHVSRTACHLFVTTGG